MLRNITSIILVCGLVALVGCSNEPEQEAFFLDESIVAYMCDWIPRDRLSLCLSTLDGKYNEIHPIQVERFQGTTTFDAGKQLDINNSGDILFDCEAATLQLCHYSVETGQMKRIGVDHHAETHTTLNNAGEVAFICFEEASPTNLADRQLCRTNISDGEIEIVADLQRADSTIELYAVAKPQITENGLIAYLCRPDAVQITNSICVKRSDSADVEVIVQDEPVRTFAINNSGKIVYNCDLHLCVTDLNGNELKRFDQQMPWMADQETTGIAMRALNLDINDNDEIAVTYGLNQLYMGSVSGDALEEIDTKEYGTLCCPNINNTGWIVFTCFISDILIPMVCSRDPENGRIYQIAIENTERSSNWGLSVNH